MEENFLMWGERGLVTTFLLDLSSQPSSKLSKFLEEIELPDGNKIGFEPQKIWCIIEPDFGNQGFGHPDAIILFENINQEKIAILLEAKRGTYDKASMNPSLRGEKGFNSSINGQLELNYCLTIALSEFSPEKKKLTEPSWILKTRYDDDRCSKLRQLKNAAVIDKVVKPIARLNINSYYHLVLTMDKINPLVISSNLPQLCDENDNDRWNTLKFNFGWINYEKLNRIAGDNFENGKYLDTFEMNLPNMKNYDFDPIDASRGVSIVYIPSINNKILFHFSWWGESSALRNYMDSSSKPEIIRNFKTSEIRSQIKNTFEPVERKANTDIKYWYNYIKKLEGEFFSSISLNVISGTK